MKKLLLFFCIPSLIFILNGCSTRAPFYLLNWGEYINPDLVEEFEMKYQVSVIMDEVGSSEDMYQKINTGATPYDVAIPGDYIIERLYHDNLLFEIDFTLLENYLENMFHDDLEKARAKDMFLNNQKYAMPYFWGTYCLIYSTEKSYVEEVVKTYGWEAIFNRSLYPGKVKLAMYDVPRFGIMAHLLNQNIDINTTDKSLLDTAVPVLKNANYDLWGDDQLKKQISAGNLDVALTQLGDFFDQYYLNEESGDPINFNCFIPENNAIFFDGMIIPKTSKNLTLAHQFIDFFIDAENAKRNASYVGYSPAIKETITSIESDPEWQNIIQKYPIYTNPLNGKEASMTKDLGKEYADYLITLMTRAKS